MVFNATFNNISVISWQSVLLVEETRVPKENHRPVASHWQTFLYNVVSLKSLDDKGINIYEVMAKTHMILFSIEFKCGRDGAMGIAT